MTTPDQVLNDLRKLIATAECGDCETPTNTRLTCQRAVDLIETLTKPAEPSPEIEDRYPIGMGVKAKSVPTGGLAVDIQSRYMREVDRLLNLAIAPEAAAQIAGGGFDSPLIYHTHDGHGVWLRSENDRDLGAEDRMWEWFYSSPNPVGEADCIFLGYPSAATPEALRACIDAAAAASSQTREILLRVGLFK